MILDWYWNKKKEELTFSYIKENGSKALLTYPVSRFKTFYETPTGRYENWNGSRCDEKWTSRPGWAEYRTFIEELSDKDKEILFANNTPKLYTFDIEVYVDQEEFPEPSEAKFPILTISICNEEMNTIVLGTSELEDASEVQRRYEKYLRGNKFFESLGIAQPKIKYLYFPDEGTMLQYFLKEIVAKAPVMAGWNSLGFDWQYIYNRVRNSYPHISMASSSIDWTMENKRIYDFRNQGTYIPIPKHTLVLDYMDIIKNFDMSMPVKESLSLDYIASQSKVGMHKIEYDGDLQELYNTDYATYVFYNAIDSVLVQLINRCFSTLDNIYLQAAYIRSKVDMAFSKIALTEGLFFNYFWNLGIRCVPQEGFDGERGTLVGAYVCDPAPGRHKWIATNDFASLYPSTIITTNISIENCMGSDFSDKELEEYRKDPNYFVTVNGVVYKNDKDYAFKNIQARLKSERGKAKYLAWKLNSEVTGDVDHIKMGRPVSTTPYDDEVKRCLKELGYDVSCGDDLKSVDINQFSWDLDREIMYLRKLEQSIKLLMNSMYGGSSHIRFEWFNILLANDITGEARWLIKHMEKEIPRVFNEEWYEMTELHKKLGITLKCGIVDTLIHNIYGDTDSCMFSYSNLLDTIEGVESMSMREKTEIIVGINEYFLNDYNNDYISNLYTQRHAKSVHEFELETVASSGIWLNVKKRYSELLSWKDGRYYDEDALGEKTKGLEIVKSSYPSLAREQLRGLVQFVIAYEGDDIIHRLNMKVQDCLRIWMSEENPDNICPTKNVNNYSKYILNDNTTTGYPEVAARCPFQVRALGTYNNLRQKYGLEGDPIYGGRLRYYYIFDKTLTKGSVQNVFAYQSNRYPTWAAEYAPIDKKFMFQQNVLDPLNRILEAIGEHTLNIDGAIQLSLFD